MQRSNESCQDEHKMDYAATSSDMIATIAGPLTVGSSQSSRRGDR